MALKGDVGLYLSGDKVCIKECNIVITPPSIRDIFVSIGEDNFLIATQILTNLDRFVKDVKEGNLELNILSDFQVLLVILQGEPRIKKIVLDFFDLIFPDYDIKVTENSIEFYLKESQSLVSVMNPFNFEVFQTVVSELFEPQNPTEEEFNPIDDKAKEIAEKLKKGREKRNQMKAQGKNQTQNTSLFATQASVLSIGLGMDINIFYNYTPFQLFDAFIRYTSKLAYDFYQRVSTMPFMNTSELEAPDDWTRGLY